MKPEFQHPISPVEAVPHSTQRSLGSHTQLTLAPFAEALEAFGRGAAVILVDDENRENEGDITVATEFLTHELLSVMTREARGLVCVSIPRVHGERLGLPLQTGSNRSKFDTPFTVSVNHRSVTDGGISFKSRLTTMRELARVDTSPDEFVCPGAVYPLMAHPAGVLGRRGQTEGGYDLARLSGLFPSAVICEVLNGDGTVARGAQLSEFATKHRMPIISVQQIIDYRLNIDVRVSEVRRSVVRTTWGEANAVSFVDEVSGREHVAVVFGEPAAHADPVLVRMHSECLTGDVFGSARCDCGPQLAAAGELIRKAGAGVILYLRQEGRGIGLANKLKAYALQDTGADTVEANEQLGLPVDARSYTVAARMLASLDIKAIRLITNNPSKIEALGAHGISVAERVPSFPKIGGLAGRYVETKQRKMGHLAAS